MPREDNRRRQKSPHRLAAGAGLEPLSSAAAVGARFDAGGGRAARAQPVDPEGCHVLGQARRGAAARPRPAPSAAVVVHIEAHSGGDGEHFCRMCMVWTDGRFRLACNQWAEELPGANPWDGLD